MYSQDLAPYMHGLPSTLPDVATVDWLSAGHDFAIGDIESDMVRGIQGLLSSNRVNEARGFHLCELCPAREPIKVASNGGSTLLGAAEVWLPSADESIVFAAPDLLFHYVVAHSYRPPRQFLEAVAASDMHAHWKPRLECERRLEGAFAK
jgi:hypothetical protein